MAKGFERQFVTELPSDTRKLGIEERLRRVLQLVAATSSLAQQNLNFAELVDDLLWFERLSDH